MNPCRLLAAALVAVGVAATGLAAAAPAAADTGTFGVAPDHVTLLDPEPDGMGWVSATLSLDPGYSFSAGDSRRIEADGTVYLSDLGDSPCNTAAPGADCRLIIYAFSTTAGESPAWTELIAECLSPGVGCRYLSLPVTVGPTSTFLTSFPRAIDFGDVPVGTTATRDVTVTTDVGYSVNNAVAPTDPFHFAFGTCDSYAVGSCTMQLSVTPTAVGPAQSFFGVMECTPGGLSCYHNQLHGVPVRVTGDRCYSGGSGPLTVGAGQTVCVTGSRVGTITVSPGGSLALLGARVTGGVLTTGAAAVTICGSTISGAVAINGSTGPVVLGDPSACAGNAFSGGLTLALNTGGVVVGGNNVRGALACTANTPAPTDDSHHNTVTGARVGQCGTPTF